MCCMHCVRQEAVNELLLVLIKRWELGDDYQNMIMPMTVCAPEQAETEDWGQVFTAQQAWCQNAR